MELLLNILWLLLALPAIFILRREAAPRFDSQNHSRLRSFLLLSCVLVLLFPVISASDDLHPLCDEIAESAITKRVVKVAHGSPHSAWGDSGAIAATPIVFAPFREENCGSVRERPVGIPLQNSASISGCRAPPTFN
jgi:hypothetical protein